MCVDQSRLSFGRRLPAPVAAASVASGRRPGRRKAGTRQAAGQACCPSFQLQATAAAQPSSITRAAVVWNIQRAALRQPVLNDALFSSFVSLSCVADVIHFPVLPFLLFLFLPFSFSLAHSVPRPPASVDYSSGEPKASSRSLSARSMAQEAVESECNSMNI